MIVPAARRGKSASAMLPIPKGLLMMKRAATLAACAAAFLLAHPATAEPPAFYRSVTSLHWVVKDAERVRGVWTKLGFASRPGTGTMTVTEYRKGETARLKVVAARFGSVDVLWLQPDSGRSAFSDYLDKHGEGVVSINYAPADGAARDAEAARLHGLGVKVLQKAEVELGGAKQSVVYADTAGKGKYVVGLALGALPPVEAAPAIPFAAKLSQYALVVKDLEEIGDFWAKLGLPAMAITHDWLSDLRFRDQPGQFDQRLGWHRHGTITFEWIEPLRGPSVYKEHLDHHGEGFHHLAFDVPDLDAAIAAWGALGAKVVQSGAWGTKGKRGSGRFAYVEADPAGGVTIELLWNQR
jgi:catechol 2,3-dioxygenase-like lactoylglutathione lyase family enzyme